MLHEQTALLGRLCEFSGHGVHGWGPDASLYLAAEHAVQDPAGPVFPAGHKFKQSCWASLPRGEVVPAGHERQVTSEVDPRAVE